jgi:hypothetical protein
VVQPEGLVDHEWEVNGLLYCGLTPNIVNMVDHLRQVSLGRARDQLERFPFAF